MDLNKIREVLKEKGYCYITLFLPSGKSALFEVVEDILVGDNDDEVERNLVYEIDQFISEFYRNETWKYEISTEKELEEIFY